jgi:hypothetical protein
VSFKITKDNLAAFTAGVKAMGARRVYVGVPGETAPRNEPINNAALAYIHDKGTALGNIPARPFMEPGIHDAQDDIVQALGSVAASDDWSVANVERSLNRAGITAVVSIKKRIVSQEGFTPLAPATIAARRKKGRMRTKALIDTGEMLNSIKHVVRDR